MEIRSEVISKMKNKRGLLIFITLITMLVLSLGVIFSLVSWNHSYVVPKAKVSFDLIDKGIKAQSKGVMELNNDELNGIIAFYSNGKKTYDDLTIKGIHGEMSGDSLQFFIPSSYKGISFLLRAEGNLGFKEGKAQYTVNKVYLGKLPISKDFVLNKLKTSMTGTMTADNSSIYLDLSSMPVKIKDVKVRDSILVVEVEKVSGVYEERLKFLENMIKDFIK